MTSTIFWFRKDLRLSDHPALNQALEAGTDVYLVATADQLGSKFFELSTPRQNSLRSSWNHLKTSLSGKLHILASPNELLRFVKEAQARAVIVSEVFDTNGVKELLAVEKDLASIGVSLIRGDGNYAVKPGTVRKGDGTPYRVYTPFFNEWFKIGHEQPFQHSSLACVSELANFQSSFDPQLALGSKTMAGEVQALETLQRFLKSRVETYDENRNRADLGGTSHLSHALSHGEIHPRTILATLPDGAGADVFRKEIAWREFYADVLWHRPESLTEYLDPKYAKMRYDSPEEKFEAWKNGKTGFPIVDAGMRQLLTTGWMHNRVRMIVASFLVKDLHLEWQLGAEWFERHLTDFDPASNSHGWQWTAGCGTDASPYYRIFNPISQGLKFDPNGDYVRRFVEELRYLGGASALEPWDNSHGYSLGYPKRIVDHAAERVEALARLEELKTTQ
jgi:deoxyribodipyrimidine photo-lyase